MNECPAGLQEVSPAERAYRNSVRHSANREESGDNSNHILGTRVPVEKPSTTSVWTLMST
jgi:hypothetical protein